VQENHTSIFVVFFCSFGRWLQNKLVFKFLEINDTVVCLAVFVIITTTYTRSQFVYTTVFLALSHFDEK